MTGRQSGDSRQGLAAPACSPQHAAPQSADQAQPGGYEQQQQEEQPALAQLMHEIELAAAAHAPASQAAPAPASGPGGAAPAITAAADEEAFLPSRPGDAGSEQLPCPAELADALLSELQLGKAWPQHMHRASDEAGLPGSYLDELMLNLLGPMSCSGSM